MANLDVSDLLLDPDFVDNVSIIRRTSTVNQYGQNVLVEATPVATVASIQPATTKQIDRVPDALRSSDMRSFFVKGAVNADTPGTYADIISYGGQRWQVVSVAPWLNYGEGWNEAVCVIEKASQ